MAEGMLAHATHNQWIGIPDIKRLLCVNTAPGWKVVAAEISDGMLAILRQKLPEACSSGRLQILKIASKDLEFPDGHFGMVTAYSVLRHLFDYMHTIKEFCRVLEKGGVMYLDHEENDRCWKLRGNRAYGIYLTLNHDLDRVYSLSGHHRQVPHIDYTWSDYGIRESSKIDWALIRDYLAERGMRFYEEPPPPPPVSD